MDQLLMLFDFLNTLPGKAIDFYPTRAAFSRPILEKINKMELQIFARTHSDSLIGFWKKNNTVNTSVESGSIVWIDSEGQPNGVIAGNPKEFISLLYFDTCFIYDTLKLKIRNQDFKLRSKQELIQYQQWAEGTYFHYAEFKNFLFERLKIVQPEHPDLIISEAYEKNDSFENWFKNAIK